PAVFQVGLDQLAEGDRVKPAAGRRQEMLQCGGPGSLPGQLEAVDQRAEIGPLAFVQVTETREARHGASASSARHRSATAIQPQLRLVGGMMSSFWMVHERSWSVKVPALDAQPWHDLCAQRAADVGGGDGRGIMVAPGSALTDWYVRFS